MLRECSVSLPIYLKEILAGMVWAHTWQCSGDHSGAKKSSQASGWHSCMQSKRLTCPCHGPRGALLWYFNSEKQVMNWFCFLPNPHVCSCTCLFAWWVENESTDDYCSLFWISPLVVQKDSYLWCCFFLNGHDSKMETFSIWDAVRSSSSSSNAS